MSGRQTVLRTITLTDSYSPLSDTTLVANFVLTSVAANTGDCYLEGDDESDVVMSARDWFEFKGVDLSTIRMKGVPGDKVTIIGHA